MDRNSAIGLTLIAALLFAYFYWFAPEVPKPAETITKSTPAVVQDSVAPANAPIDSTTIKSFGELGSYVTGDASETKFETQDIKVTFSNKGGIIRELELKNYKTYSQKSLKLIDPNSNQFSLLSKIQNKDVDLYSLYYSKDEQKRGDTTILTYKIQLAGGKSISHIYSIPAKG